MTETIAILGGGGAFAIHTAKYLLDHASPAKVIGIGRAPLRAEPFSLGIDRAQRYEYRVIHIGYEFDLLMECLDRERPSVIINFAAQGEGAVSWTHSWRYFETNAVALSRLVEALSSRAWLRRFIQIGSSEVYGSTDCAATEDEPIKPTSPYAASKVAFDLYLQAMARSKGFPGIILRPCNAYCPGQLLHRVIPRAIWSGLTGRKLPLQGGGMVEKSYIHARDLARAIFLLLDGGKAGEVYNAGTDQSTPIRHVVAHAAAALGIALGDLVEMVPGRPSEDNRYCLDSAKIQDAVSWRPEIGWESGMAEMVTWGRRYWGQISDMSPEYVFRG